MKPTVPRDWTKTEVCTPYPPMTPKKATCKQSVRGIVQSESKNSAMKQIDKSSVYYRHYHRGIAACLDKHLNLYKLVSCRHVICFFFQTPPIIFSTFSPNIIPKNTYQTLLVHLLWIFGRKDSPNQRLSAINVILSTANALPFLIVRVVQA